jgi:hypothetical protein
MRTVEIPVNQIDVGERRRQDFGDVKALAAGIKRVGLLEPILVDRNGGASYRLIFGHRRLEAHRMLGLPTIRAQLCEELTEAQLRAIELEENENRKSLTESERTRSLVSSKRLVEKAKTAAGILEQNVPKKSGKRGRPSEPASTRAIAAALGTTKTDVKRAEQHVALAERCPFMRGQGWRQSSALAVQEHLNEFPAGEADNAIAVLNCAKLLHPTNALEILGNLLEQSVAERKRIYKLAGSDDPRERERSLTDAANKPPMPDPRVSILNMVIDHLNHTIRPYPHDPLTPRLIDVRAEIGLIKNAIKTHPPQNSRQSQTEVLQ